MGTSNEGFVLQTAPHAHAPSSIPKIMHAVNISLIPIIVFSAFLFGADVLLLYIIGVASCVATEALCKIARKRDWRTVYDGSAILTGLLLVMVLPPDASPVIVALGGAVSIFIGKEVFGGLGQNVFNPALVGRAFLSAAYPVQMTTWRAPNEVFGFLPSAQTMGMDSVTGATPLAAARFEGTTESLARLFFGQTAGSIGATSVLLIMVGGLALTFMGLVKWRMLLSYFGTVTAVTGVFWLINPAEFINPLYHLFAGGIAFAGFYMMSDMVTTPYTNRGLIIFGIGAGILTAIIRLFSGFPEGVMYAILLMNAVTPIINRYNATPFGAQPKQGKEKTEKAGANA
jgi:electron transport complex protein RnfD